MQIIRQETDYGIRALLYLLSADGATAPCGEIAEVCEIPQSFAYKVLRKLAEAGIVRSGTGCKGGFELARQAREVSLADIVQAMQGRLELSKCVFDADACSRRDHCPMSGQWGKLQEGMVSFLSGTSLHDIAGAFARSAG